MKHHPFRLPTLRGLSSVALAAVAAFLSGCSGEPSASDIDKTVRAYMTESQTQLQKVSGTKSPLGEIHDVKKLGCKSDTNVSWHCDVELDMTQFGNRAKGPASFRFVKSPDGWALAR